VGQMKVAVGGTLLSAGFGGCLKLATLPTSPVRIAGLFPLIALSVVLLVAAEYLGPSTVPQSQRDTAPSPTGAWHCVFGGETAGKLTVDGWRYTLTFGGELAGEGTLAPVGGRTPKNNAALVHVESGPLKEIFGISVGLHEDRTEPEKLIFNMGPGAGVPCSRN
jgi:hypothetical protein